MKETFKAGWAVVRAYMPTIIAMVVLAIVFLSIPQVRSLFITPGEWNDEGVSIKFLAFSFGIGLIYLGAFLWVIEPRLVPLLKVKSDEIPKANFKSALLLLVIMVMCLASISWWPETPDTPSCLEDAVRFSAALFLFFWAIYYLICGLMPVTMAAMLWRALAAATFFGVAGEILWWAGLNWSIASPRIYSIGAICYIAFVIAICFTYIDRWHALQPNLFIRFFTVLAVIALVLLSYESPQIGNLTRSQSQAVAGDVLDTDTATTINWLKNFQARLNRTDQHHPVIIVASSGGGSRAALFAALIYEGLSEFGSPAQQEAWVFDNKKPFNPEKQIVLVSSVSGGSLASACFTDQHYRSQRLGKITAPANYDPSLITRMMNDEAQHLDALFTEMHGETWKIVREKCKEAKESQGKSDESAKSHPFLHQQFVDDMCADFMAPLLRGVIHLSRERGEAVTWFWRRRFGLEQTPQDTQSDEVPLWMSNSTDVDSGRPFVIGFPPLPPKLISPAKLKSRTFEQDVADWKLSKAEAVRLSANFPWGFDVPTTPLTVRHRRAAGAGELIEPLNLIDGGVFDNSGIVTIRSLLNSIRTLAEENAAPVQAPQRAQIIELARAVQTRLSEQGIILLEIDSGAKPEPAGFVSKMLPSVLKPINALNNSAYHNSERISLDNTSTIQTDLRNADIEKLKHRLAATLRYAGAAPATIEQIDSIFVENVHFLKLTCNEEDNVMTAWALPPDDKAKIFVRAMVEVEELRESLRRAVNVHSKAKAIYAKISDEVLELEQDMKSQDKIDRASVEKLADEFLLVTNIITNQKLEQDQKNALATLYAQKATPEKYQAVYQEFSQLKLKLPMPISEVFDPATAELGGNVKFEAWGASVPNEIKAAPKKVIEAMKEKPRILHARSIEEESDALDKAKYRLKNIKKAF